MSTSGSDGTVLAVPDRSNTPPTNVPLAHQASRRALALKLTQTYTSGLNPGQCQRVSGS